MYNKGLLILVSFILLIACNPTKQYVTDVEHDYHRTTKEYDQNQKAISDIIAPYKADLDSEMNAVIGVLPFKLRKSRPNSYLGNWFTDIMHDIASEYQSDVAFALQNYGGLRIPQLPEGDLITRNIYELMPFDNNLVFLELDGKTTKQLIDLMAEDNGWPISRGLSFKIEDKKATEIVINGEPFDSSKKYMIALPDYVANGGGGTFFLKDIPQINSDMLIRDLVIAHLQKMKAQDQPLTIDTNERIH